MSEVGSIAPVSRCPRYVRSSPESGRIADIAALRISASTGTGRYLIASSRLLDFARLISPNCRSPNCRL
jgi:hypothetical protein